MAEVEDALDNQASYRLFRRDYAEGKAPLVIVCGSGLSAPANLPTWPMLRAKLQAEAEARAQTLSQMGEALLLQRVAAARKQESPWIAFKLLRDILTPSVFERLIEEELTPDPEVDIPKSYLELCRLRPRGIVTLNLDKFAGEAFLKVTGDSQITPIYGSELAQKWYAIVQSHTYLLYLHGVLEDPSSWVLTQDDLTNLTKTEGHAHFLRRLFTENLVLFVGISPDDVALSGRLLELTAGGFRPRNLYWLTTRVDAAAEQWAVAGHVSLIQYPSRTLNDHNTAIQKLVRDCLAFRSSDEPEAPLVNSSPALSKTAPSDTIDPLKLANEDPETVRYTLAITLNDILVRAGKDEEKRFSVYRDFCKKYSFALNRAFYRDGESFNTWFDYELEFPAIGQGNFGEVYSAKDRNGDLVAVKIMHSSIFGKDDMLGGFRRGVRSMQFITENSTPGMVPIKESFELPPTIVMPFVLGSSLEDSLRDVPDMPWLTRIDIAVKTAKIIRGGHSLPQTIMHRDVKPSNIMVTNLMYDGAFDPDVVVLDFDMSWHKGSKERDITFESRDDFGYLAPEQTDASNKYGARSTKVDSYGLGMTLYSIFGMKAPMPNEALSDGWYEKALRATKRGYTSEWKSAPARLARLICRATAIDQGQRVDFATLTRELSAIAWSVRNPVSLDNPDLWAEEVLSNLVIGTSYAWDDATQSGKLLTASGITAASRGDIRNETVELELGYSDRGMKERATLAKFLGPAVDGAEKVLRGGGWSILERRHSSSEASIKAKIAIKVLCENTPTVLAAAAAAMHGFDLQ